MANPLTGDFEAVLQISGSTINRLAATMHQNAFTNPQLPSFPHMIRMRIGDDYAIDGVRGLVFGQLGVPRIHLIHGVTDRFGVEVHVRAWYRPDPGTNPLPTYINGTVHAEYTLKEIDPQCFGWSKLASDYLWIRVVKDSVTFRGTGEDDMDPVLDPIAGVSTADPAAVAAANIDKVTKQIANQLAVRFEPTPHQVSKRFRRGSMRSLNAPIGGSAVAIAIGLSGEPVGNIHSINNLLLEGSDLAIGVSITYILSTMEPLLNAIKAFNTTVPVHISTGKYNPIPDFDTIYHVGVHPPTVEWDPHISHALLKITVNGWANTNSIAPNATVKITQDIRLEFDAGNGNFLLTPLSPEVNVDLSGVAGWFGVEGTIENLVAKMVQPIVQAACNSAQPGLGVMITGTHELSQQLRTLDGQATVSLDQGLFLRDGIIVRGTIGLTSRQAIVVRNGMTSAQDAHTALESWIPGGRIDKFEWSWSWAGSGDPGQRTFTDRFLLRRPPGITGRWGGGIGLTLPLPGLDGWGTVCLKISGVRVDSFTGEFVPVKSSMRCTRFGFRITDKFRNGERLFLRDMPELSQRVPFPQLSLFSPQPWGTTTNTLLIYVDRGWDEHLAAIIERGLENCRRYDAGLALLILFKEGILESAGSHLIEEVEGLARKIGIPALVNEDVRGGWTRALALRVGTGEVGWAIITPEGAAAWTHQGRVSVEDLGSALDTHLRRSGDAKPVAFRIAAEVGHQVTAAALYPGLSDLGESRCPPPPLGQLGIKGAAVTFVQKDSQASIEIIRRLVSQHEGPEGSGSVVVAVIDGADGRDVQTLKEQLQLDFVPIPDRSGTITDRFGVGVWPTTIMLDHGGIISEIQTGFATISAETDGESAL